MAKRRTSPTRPELIGALDTICPGALACFGYYFWFKNCLPQLSPEEPYGELRIREIQNTVLSGTLLAIRRMNEFFRASSPNHTPREGDIFSFDFPGFGDVGCFLLDEDFQLIHTHIGHLTLARHREGNVSWEVFPATVLAIDKFLSFLDYVRSDFYKDAPDKVNGIECYRKLLAELLADYKRDARESK